MWDAWDASAYNTRIRFCGDETNVILGSLEELAKQSSALGFNVGSEVREQPALWARFISSSLLIPFPLSGTSEGLYRGYGIDASNFPLAIEDNILKWYGLKPPDPSGPALLVEVTCVIETLSVSFIKKTLPPFNPNAARKSSN
jgi:hypothetical protein